MPTFPRNIITAASKIFTSNRPGELDARLNIERTLRAANRNIAAPAVLRPTELSNKGVSQGAISTEEHGVGSQYYRYIERESLRSLRYNLYNRMDADLIASALDVYANEATQRNANGKLIEVKSPSAYIQNELEELLERIGINGNKSWSILREMCKYGDHFVSLVLDSKQGILGMKPLNCSSVYRKEEENELVGYLQDLNVLRDTIRSSQSSNVVTNPYINLNTITAQYINRNEADAYGSGEDPHIIDFLNYELIHFKITGSSIYFPYGTSVLEQAVDIWKKTDLLVDSIIIYRLNKAPSRYAFYVDIGNNQGTDVENIINKQMQKINKKEYLDANGKINERYQLLDMNANIYLPTGKNLNSKVELLSGAGNLDQIEDVKYLTDRLFSALKVPKAFLGFEGDVSSKGMLSQQNVTFSKAVQHIQEDFLQGLKDICLIHLAIKGLADTEVLSSFELTMTHPSYIEEKARIELETSKVSLASSIINLAPQNIDIKWVLKHVLNKTDAEIKAMLVEQPQGQAEMAGGLGGGLSMPPMTGGDMGLDLGGGMGLEAGLGGSEQALTQAPPMQAPPVEAGAVLQQSFGYGDGSLLMEGTKVGVSFSPQNYSDVLRYATAKKLYLEEHYSKPQKADAEISENPDLLAE